MTPKIGYLLPTREHIMNGQAETRSLLALGDRAEVLGYDSIWVGDSLLAKPRHEPLTLLAAIAGRTSRMRLGTAVLLAALRNPVLLAHQVATLDQISEGRVILGVGIAADLPNIRAEFKAAGVEFEGRVGRMMEAIRLCQALWRGEKTNWDGRWVVEDGVLAPTPFQTGGPPIWYGGGAKASRIRLGKYYDGWFPTGPPLPEFSNQWNEVKEAAVAAGRDPDAINIASYLTIAIDEDSARGDHAINEYLESYYKLPSDKLRRWQASFAGSPSAVAEWLQAYARAGTNHFVLRFVGDHKKMLDQVARIRSDLDW